MSASTTSAPSSPLSLAQTMGFSSFGAKPNPKKKRKLEHPSTASGSNSLPRGTGRRQGSELASKTDIGREKILVEEESEKGISSRQEAEKDEDGNAGTAGKGDGATAPHSLRSHPHNTDPSPDSRTAELNDTKYHPELHLPSKELSFHSPITLPPRPPPPTSSSHEVQSQSHPQSASETLIAQYTQQSRHIRALRRGIKDENGDMAYYDESFVEDPWRALGI